MQKSRLSINMKKTKILRNGEKWNIKWVGGTIEEVDEQW